MFKNKLKPLQVAESKFGYELCEASAIFSEPMQVAIKNNDNSLKDEFLSYYNSILDASKNYIEKSLEYKDSVTKEASKIDLEAFLVKLNNQYKANTKDLDIKSLFCNLTQAIQDTVKVISNDASDVGKDLLQSYRNKRQKTYSKLNWRNFVCGAYSYRNIALEELFLGLMCYSKGLFERKDLKEYERWHGFSKGGKVTKGEVFRLVDSMKNQWEKVKFYRF